MPSAPLIQMRHSDRHCEHGSQAFGRVATCIDSGSHGFSKGGWIVERSTISFVAHSADRLLNVERSTSAPLVAVPAAALDVERSTTSVVAHPAHHPLNVERSTSAPLVAVPAATLDVERSTISVVAHPAHHPLNVERSTSAPLVAVPAATLDVERSTFGLNVQPRPTELRLRPPPTLSHPASTPLNPAAKRGSVLLGSSKLNVKKPMTWT